MRYVDFREAIGKALRKNPAGMTWRQLEDGLSLPCARPCPTWVARLEKEIGLTRTGKAGHPLIWRIGE